MAASKHGCCAIRINCGTPIGWHRLVISWLSRAASLHNGTMIRIELIAHGNLATFKTIRLRALEDTPSAFGSTYARESAMSNAEWNDRVERWSGESGIGFLALDGEAACGIAGAFLDRNDRTRAQLISMWTAPTHRRRGVGRMLVEAVARWAHVRGATVLQLMVTSKNDAAIRFYERLGFLRTGRTEPYPNDPALVEYEMARPLP
jgi:ribosomal protein S18 acetylase RimI-like enzyme